MLSALVKPVDNIGMAGRRYFCPEIHEGRLELPPDEAHHAAAVMRVRRGEPVILFDGQGGTAPGTVSAVSRQSVCVEITAAPQRTPRPMPILNLFVAAPKAARQHVLVEKCTELGVSALHPIVTERSVVRPTKATLEKWRRWTVEAAKQSGQSWLPEIGSAESFTDSLSSERRGSGSRPTTAGLRLGRLHSPPSFARDSSVATAKSSLLLIASPEAESKPISDVLSNTVAQSQSIHVWIGPEGGFSPKELDAAFAAGLQPISLGASILRIETSAIAVAALIRLGCH